MTIKDQWIAFGVDGVFIGFYDDDGLFTGGNGTLQRGEQSFDRRWQAAKSVATAIPERNRTTITGDDRPQGFFNSERTDSPSVAIQVANRIAALESDMVGLNAFQRNQYKALLIDPLIGGIRQNVSLIAHSQAKANEYGAIEESGWEINDFFKGEMSSGSPAGLEEQTGHAYDFSMTLERQSIYPDHVALTVANEKTTEASGNVYGDQYRLRRGAFFGDGTMTQINLPETPAADHKDTDIFAVEVTKRTSVGVVSILTPTTDYTTDVTNKQLNLVAAALDGERYVVNLKY